MKELRIGEVITISKGKKVSNVFNVKNKETDHLRYIQIEDLRHNNNLKYTDELGLVKVSSNDCIIAWDGSKSGTVNYGLNGIIGSTLARLTIKDNFRNELDSSYLGLFLQFNYEYFQKTNTGAAIPHVNKNALCDLTIPLPEFQIQKQIVSILDKAQVLIHKREQSLSLLDELMRATFFDMFGDPTSDMKFQTQKLIKGLKMIGGHAFKSKDFIKEGIPVIKIGTVNKGYFDENSFSFLPTHYDHKYSKYRVIPGDLLITLTGTVGKDDFANVCFANSSHKEYLLNQRVAKFSIDKNIYNANFLYYMMKHGKVKHILVKRSKGVRQANISNTDVATLKLIYPDISTQEIFSTIVEKIETQKEIVQKSLQEANNLFQSLLQEAFSGSLKIKDNKLALQSALDKIEWFDEQIKQVTSNKAIEKLQKQMEAFNKISEPFDKITKLQKQLDKFKLPNLDKINAFQKSLEKLNSPQLKAINNFEQFNRLKENEFLKKISDDQSFKIKSFEEFQKAEKQRKLEEELKTESDPVLQFIGSEQIGKFTVDNYKINIARAIHKFFGKREFDIDSLVEALKNEKGITNVKKAAVKKDLFKIFKEFIIKKHYGMFSFERMRQSMKKHLFNPSFELLQEFIDSEMKLKSEDRLSQVYFDDLHKDPSDPYYNDKSLFEKNRTFQLYEERIYLQYKVEADED